MNRETSLPQRPVVMSILVTAELLMPSRTAVTQQGLKKYLVNKRLICPLEMQDVSFHRDKVKDSMWNKVSVSISHF